jgi:tricorn protease-like protein
VRRELPAASGARAAVVSVSRKILFTSGSRNGKLVSTDIVTAKVLREDRVGGKVFALKTDPNGKELYIAASNGVFIVDIEEYLKPGGKGGVKR